MCGRRVAPQGGTQRTLECCLRSHSSVRLQASAGSGGSNEVYILVQVGLGATQPHLPTTERKEPHEAPTLYAALQRDDARVPRHATRYTQDRCTGAVEEEEMSSVVRHALWSMYTTATGRALLSRGQRTARRKKEWT